MRGLNGTAEAEAMAHLSLQAVEAAAAADTLESRLWQWGEAYSGCCSEAAVSPQGVKAVTGRGSLDVSPAAAVREAYMPRPIVSLHVEEWGRHGGGGVWSYLQQLYRLRGHEPGLKYVWLTADDEVRGWGWVWKKIGRHGKGDGVEGNDAMVFASLQFDCATSRLQGMPACCAAM